METLRQRREERRMTLKQVGNAIGVSAVTISRYEKGEREPNIDKLKKLSQVLGTPVDDLITDSPGERGN